MQCIFLSILDSSHIQVFPRYVLGCLKVWAIFCVSKRMARGACYQGCDISMSLKYRYHRPRRYSKTAKYSYRQAVFTGVLEG